MSDCPFLNPQTKPALESLPLFDENQMKEKGAKIKNQKVNIENMKMNLNQLLFWATLAVKQEG